jgi:lipoprotein-anchoring transpeptidase ErfK/SrfK
MPYQIIVSLQRKQLTLMKGTELVRLYPIGIGKMLSPTPAGVYTIVNKVPHPGGPFGVMWMGLSRPHYGIHGTNAPWTIGQRASKGCIRMHNADVLALSALVPIGTLVTIRP